MKQRPERPHVFADASLDPQPAAAQRLSCVPLTSDLVGKDLALEPMPMSEPLTTHRIARHVRRATRTGLSRCHYCGQELHGTNSEIERLREDNRYLKESAQFFAELSERLNNELRRKQRT